MNGKDNKRPATPPKGQKLDVLRQALETRTKPTDKFMRAFQSLMNKDKSD